MSQFIDYIHNISPLTAEAVADIQTKIQSREYKKGQFVISEHQVCENLFFLKNGLVKLYFIGDKGREIVIRFFSENSPFSSLESFLGQKNTAHVILALEPTEVDLLSKQDVEELCVKHHCFERFWRIALSFAVRHMINRISQLMKDEATVRYNEFIAENSALMQRISLGDLAGYLGITQVSLSRIRASK